MGGQWRQFRNTNVCNWVEHIWYWDKMRRKGQFDVPLPIHSVENIAPNKHFGNPSKSIVMSGLKGNKNWKELKSIQRKRSKRLRERHKSFCELQSYWKKTNDFREKEIRVRRWRRGRTGAGAEWEGGKTSKWCNVSRKMGRMIDGWPPGEHIIKIPQNYSNRDYSVNCRETCWHKIIRISMKDSLKEQSCKRKGKLAAQFS